MDVFEPPLNGYRNIVEYQVRRRPDGAEVLIVPKGKVAMEKVRSDIEEGLRRLGLEDALVTVKIVEKLHRKFAGKVRRYMPMPRQG